jgi:GntR family transcriptional regulator
MTTWPHRTGDPGCSRASGLGPLYRRIADDMLMAIEAGRMQPGEPLPTESDFCAAYGVSRITIRKALDELVARHVIDRRRGSGTYISSAERITKSVVLSGYIDDVLMLNRMTVLEDAWRTLPPHLAAFAGVEGDREFKQIVGVNYITPDEPIVHIAFWFPPEIATRVSAADVAGPLPTIKHIEQSHGLRLDHAIQVLDAISASAPVAAALGVKRGTPLLRALRAYYDADKALIEIFEAQYHPARYHFSATLFPKHA